jgi:hypothetical protein
LISRFRQDALHSVTGEGWRVRPPREAGRNNRLSSWARQPYSRRPAK